MPDPKTLVDMGLNTAIMGAFAIPEVGAEVAAGLAIGQFFFDLFCPEAQTSTDYAIVDKATLDSALATLKDELAELAWKGNTKTVTTDVSGQNDLFILYWNWLKTLKSDDEAFIFIQDTTEQGFQKSCDDYFNYLAQGGAWLVLDKARTNITLSDLDDTATAEEKLEYLQHRSKTLGLYGLIASLTVSYLKMAAVWQWSQEMMPFIRYKKYLADKANWDSKLQAYKTAHPNWQPVAIADPGPMPLWEDWIAETGCPVGQLVKTVDFFVAQVEGTPKTATDPARKGLYEILVENWKKRPAGVDSRYESALTVKNANGYSVCHDSVTGIDYFGSGSPSFAPSEMDQIYEYDFIEEVFGEWQRGGMVAFEYRNLTHGYALEGVTADDLRKFAGMINAWKTAKDSVRFTTHIVTQGETLDTIAAGIHPGANLTDKQRKQMIVDANPSLAKSTAVVKDQRLKIPDLPMPKTMIPNL